jgi:hypothetical protein
MEITLTGGCSGKSGYEAKITSALLGLKRLMGAAANSLSALSPFKASNFPPGAINRQLICSNFGKGATALAVTI